MTTRLKQLEEEIESFQRSRLRAGRALREINRDGLYEEPGYRNITEYANDRFGFGSSRTYQLINYAGVVEEIEDADLKTPQNAAQAEPLFRLLGEDGLTEVWELALDRHGHSGLTKEKVSETTQEYLSNETVADEKEAPVEEVSLAVPRPTAEKLGLSGTDHRARRVVPWDGMTRTEVSEIVEETDPQTAAPMNADAEPIIGSKVWTPVRGENRSYRLADETATEIQFRPDDVQRLQESKVPASSQGGLLATEPTDTLVSPEVDLLSEDVPDPFTREVLDRSAGTPWSPVFLSRHHERWTDYDLPDEGWIGSRSSRTSIEEVIRSLKAAGETAIKWTLYDLGGDDRREGLPETDLSVLDWIVIDTPGGGGVQLSYDELTTLHASASRHELTLSVRDPFTSEVRAKPCP